MNTEMYKEEKKFLDSTLKLLQAKIKMHDYKIIENKNEILRNIKYLYGSEIENQVLLKNENIIRQNNLDIFKNQNINYIQMLNNTYFARIDFIDDIEKNKEKIYLGIATLHDSDYNVFVYDWRAPIGELFYNYQLGRAKYQISNGGFIEGFIDLKRQIDIINGKIVNIFNTDIEIQDSILKKMLSNDASLQLKSIIKTIQQEQNEIIRNNSKNILVQGIAGSGKSTIALHRISYLLYKEKGLRNHEVLIISPNQLFSKYIIDILPEIGSDQVYQSEMQDLLSYLNSEFNFITDKNLVQEMLFSDRYIKSDDMFYSKILKKSIREKEVLEYKLSNKIFKIIDKYIKYLKYNLGIYDITYNSNFKISKKEIYAFRDQFLSKYTIKEQIEGMLSRIEFLLDTTIPDLEFINKEKQKLKKIKKLNTRELYGNMFLNIEFLKEASLNEQEFSILREHYIDIVGGNLRYEDIDGYLYFKMKISEYEENENIKLIVIDEVQDYTITQIKLLKQIYKNAKFIFLGDNNQSILHCLNYNLLLEEFADISYFELNKAFRNTIQINKFTNRLLSINNSNIEREGEEVNTIKIDIQDYIDNVICQILKHKRKITAVIVKNLEELKAFREYALENYREIKFNYIQKDEDEIKHGVNIITAYMSKGLEFDYVIIYNSDSYNFEDLREKNLFYVSCTRALHKLDICYANFNKFIY